MPGWKVEVRRSADDGKGWADVYMVNVADRNAAMDIALKTSGGSNAEISGEASDEMIAHFAIAAGEAKKVLSVGSDGIKTPKAN